MDNLPLEIIHHIAEEIRSDWSHATWKCYALTPLACVNKFLRAAIEPLIWREVTLKYDQLQTFHDCFADIGRRQYLRKLHLTLDGFFENDFDKNTERSLYRVVVDDELPDGPDEDVINIFGVYHQLSDISTITGLEVQADTETWTTAGGAGRPGMLRITGPMMETWIREDAFWKNLEHRASAARAHHFRCFQEIEKIWTELAGWDSDLKLKDIQLRLVGKSIYKSLGPETIWSPTTTVRPVERYGDLSWLQRGPGIPLTSLSSVTSFNVFSNSDLDLWPAIVGCDIARTLPNVEDVFMGSDELQRLWPRLHITLRRVLAQRITRLPRNALQAFTMDLPFQHEFDSNVILCNHVNKGVDLLSLSLNSIFTHVTTLAVNINQLSPSLFCDATVSSPFPAWPNLMELHIDTGFLTACGDYSMKIPNKQFYPHPSCVDDGENISTVEPGFEYHESDWDEFGEYLLKCPEPVYFNELSISLARAVNHMPKLRSITIEMISERTDNESFTGYHGWGFAFRSGPEARFPKAREKTSWVCGHPGIDLCVQQGPRREWTFRCEPHQVAWEEPEEACRLWEKRFPGIASDIIAYELDEDENLKGCWKGQRSDVNIRREQMRAETPESWDGRDLQTEIAMGEYFGYH